MRFCFVLEEKYIYQPMPMAIADQLQQWGHEVDILRSHAALTSSMEDLALASYDVCVLKATSDGPGLTILEAAEAIGIPTINNSRAIRLVLNKASAAAYAYASHLPVPLTYCVGLPNALVKLPPNLYPLVIRPSNGMQDTHLVSTYEEMAQLTLDDQVQYLAMRYVENAGYDIKLYVTGQEVHAITRTSPFHKEIQGQEIQVTNAMLQLVQQVGQIFGLDIYGIDVLETPQGLVVVDIDDFPSFSGVPRNVVAISEYLLHIAYRHHSEREKGVEHLAKQLKDLRRHDETLVPAELMRESPSVKRVNMN